LIGFKRLSKYGDMPTAERREIEILRWWRRLQYREIADALMIAEGTVRLHFSASFENGGEEIETRARAEGS